MFRDLNGKIDYFQIFMALLTLLAIIGVIVLSYWVWFDDKVPATIGEVAIHNPEVEEGGLLRYSVEACKYTDHIATIHRTFIDGLVLATPEVRGGHVPQGCAIANLGIQIPEGLPPGNYMLEVILSYKVNPISDREVTYMVGPFDVIEAR